jgi:hypothetical protein
MRSNTAMSLSPRLVRTAACAALAVACSLHLQGCTLIGGMAESYKQNSTHAVPAEYTGLTGKSVAVVVIADRSIEADFPGISATLIERFNERIRQFCNPSKAFPSVQLVQFLTNNPQLMVRPPQRARCRAWRPAARHHGSPGVPPQRPRQPVPVGRCCSGAGLGD